MKLFAFLLLFSSFAIAKNRILYVTCVNCTKDSKESPLYDLSVQADFKKPQQIRTLESRSTFSFGSSSDFIVYIKQGAKDNNSLYIITDFSTYNKVKIMEDVSHFKIKNGTLFFEKFEKSGDGIISILYAISDFKTLTKQEIHRGYSGYAIDDY